MAGDVGSQLQVDALVDQADAAMYAAKSLGRNRTYLYRAVDESAPVRRAPISTDHRDAATAIGRWASDTATEALASVLAPQPHHRGRPSDMIASLATGIALEMGLPRDEIERIRVASLLHDLGKLAVPPEILDKPSALSDGEWQAIGEHPRIGQVILEQASSLREAIPVVLHHHERFNGGGYPHGLRGNEIPMGARIVAVADAYHAMVHDRPYKPALDHDQALNELRQNAGTQFDPDVVEVFCAVYADGVPPDGLEEVYRLHERARGGLEHIDPYAAVGFPGRRGPDRRRARGVSPQATQPTHEQAGPPRGERLMSRRRVSVLVAILAALVWAPSSVLAASPNRLSQASVTPTSGETSTVFVVTVRYRSTAGNPATAVTLTAGGQVSAMVLVSGTATDGKWMGTAVLPPGEWDITVAATVEQGAQPSLSAGTVSVAGGSTQPPTVIGNDPSSTAPPSGGGGGQVSSPAPQPVATPRPGAASTPAPARNNPEAAPSQPPTRPVGGAAAPAGPGRHGAAPARSPRADPADSSNGAQRSDPASPSSSGTPAQGRESGDLGLFMMIGTLAVGVVALLGSAWIFAATRRDREALTDPGVMAAAIVDQRAMRRARLRSADDPILAAMGLPDDDTAPGAAPPARAKSAGSRGRRRTSKR